MSWQTPKTNWVATDYINYTDYNRIARNLEWLRDKALEMYAELSISSMPTQPGYTASAFADEINLLEQNLATINTKTYRLNIGTTRTYVANQPTINYVELNRIESACLRIKTYLDSQYEARRRLAFTLGSQKGIKV